MPPIACRNCFHYLDCFLEISKGKRIECTLDRNLRKQDEREREKTVMVHNRAQVF